MSIVISEDEFEALIEESMQGLNALQPDFVVLAQARLAQLTKEMRCEANPDQDDLGH